MSRRYKTDDLLSRCIGHSLAAACGGMHTLKIFVCTRTSYAGMLRFLVCALSAGRESSFTPGHEPYTACRNYSSKLVADSLGDERIEEVLLLGWTRGFNCEGTEISTARENVRHIRPRIGGHVDSPPLPLPRTSIHRG